jgi:hypothetical protein
VCWGPGFTHVDLWQTGGIAGQRTNRAPVPFKVIGQVKVIRQAIATTSQGRNIAV